MTHQEQKSLYESIMKEVSKSIKKQLNEYSENYIYEWNEKILPSLTEDDFTTETGVQKIIKMTSGIVKLKDSFETQCSVESFYEDITIDYRIRLRADSLVHLLEMISTFIMLFDPYNSDKKTTLSKLNWQKPNNGKLDDYYDYGCIFNDRPKISYFVRTLASKWDGFTNKQFENKYYWNDSEHRAEDIIYQIKLELDGEHLTHENMHIVFDEFNEYFKNVGRLLYKIIK